MRPSTLLPALLATATARIVGIAAPSQLSPGSDFNVTLITANYIQAITDVSAAVGLSTVQFPDTLGTYVGSFYIGPDESVHRGDESLRRIVSADDDHLVAGRDHCQLYDRFGVDLDTGRCECVRNSLTQLFRFGFSDGFLINRGNKHSLVQSDFAASRTQYTSLSSSFDEVSALASPKRSNCPQPLAGKALSQAEALQVIQSIQANLSLVELDVANGDGVAALKDVCAARAAWFSSGLRELNFR